MRVTADDVAEAAGVSRAMVSRAFTEGAPIAARKRAHVLAVADPSATAPTASPAASPAARPASSPLWSAPSPAPMKLGCWKP
ncbi:hypothetical protein V6L77_22080 [Pannonibacter sp. Pt2-lr]